MEIVLIKESYLRQLKSSINENLNYYSKNRLWLEDYFNHNEWYIRTNINIKDIKLKKSKGNKHYDFENTKLIYSALKDLTLTQATDERLWAYLTHITFWDYMRNRWPIENYKKGSEDKNKQNFIRNRYFFMQQSDRSLIMNGISRLWWFGYVSYDDNRDDPFELTRVLLEKQDIAHNILERTFSRNPLITKTILSVLLEQEKLGKPFYNREKFRQLMKYFNFIGGVTVLDSLDQEDIEDILRKQIERLA